MAAREHLQVVPENFIFCEIYLRFLWLAGPAADNLWKLFFNFLKSKNRTCRDFHWGQLLKRTRKKRQACCDSQFLVIPQHMTITLDTEQTHAHVKLPKESMEWLWQKCDIYSMDMHRFKIPFPLNQKLALKRMVLCTFLKTNNIYFFSFQWMGYCVVWKWDTILAIFSTLLTKSVFFQRRPHRQETLPAPSDHPKCLEQPPAVHHRHDPQNDSQTTN